VLVELIVIWVVLVVFLSIFFPVDWIFLFGVSFLGV